MATGKPSKSTTDEEILQHTLENMDKHNIEKSVISWSLEHVYRWMDEAPDRFIPGVAFFQHPFPDPEMLRDEIKAGRIRFMGEIGAQLAGVPPNDPILEPYFALAEEYDLSVHIHCAGVGPHLPSYKIKNGNPLLMEEVVSKHPNMRIFVENAGYPFLAEMTAIMMMYPNVYADLSTISWLTPRKAFYDYFERLMNFAFVGGEPIAKRLMFGSDQMRWPETIEWAIEAYEEAPFLTEDQKKDIF
jgi:predicted TIM-barrel fold metal-dependent hydrolase